MRVLLGTHAFLWLVLDDPRLSAHALEELLLGFSPNHRNENRQVEQ